MNFEIESIIFLIFMLIVLSCVTFVLLKAYIKQENLNKKCESIGYEYPRQVIEDKYNCCKLIAKIVNGTYIKEEQCVISP